MNRLIWLMLLFPAFCLADDKPVRELDLNARYCASIGGQTEVRYEYIFNGGERAHVIADCETDGWVYEMGLDKRSSLDSIQQVLFFNHLTRKRTAVVIFDTDGVEGKFETQIRHACEYAQIKYISVRADNL